MAIDDALLKRIKKLLALSTSSNEHEAAAAAAKAQALMFEHNLVMAQVEGVDLAPDLTKVDKTYATIESKPGDGTEWQRDLADYVARSSFCKVLYSGSRRLIWIGRKPDVEMAQYTFSFLTAELRRLRDEYGKERWAEAKAEAKARGITFHQWESESKWDYSRVHPLEAKNQWIRGAVDGVGRKMLDEFRSRQKATEQSTALVAVRGAELDAYMEDHFPKIGTRRSASAYGADYMAGVKHGQSMSVRPGIGQGTQKGAIR